MCFAVVVLICVVLCYRRSEVPGGGPGREGIRGGGEPMPISGSCVNRKPCRRRRCKWQKTYLTSVWTPQLHHKIYRCNKSADNNKEKEQHGQMKRAVQSEGCLIRRRGEKKQIEAAPGNFFFFLLVCVQSSNALIPAKLLPCRWAVDNSQTDSTNCSSQHVCAKMYAQAKHRPAQRDVFPSNQHNSHPTHLVTHNSACTLFTVSKLCFFTG